MYRVLHIPTAQYIYVCITSYGEPLYYLERDARCNGLFDEGENWSILLLNSKKEFKAKDDVWKDRLCGNIQEDIKGGPLKSDPIIVSMSEFELIKIGDRDEKT